MGNLSIKSNRIQLLLNWLKKSWMQIVNIIILFIAYGALATTTVAGTLVGLWVFILLGYYIFWKLFKFEEVWDKRKRKLNK